MQTSTAPRTAAGDVDAAPVLEIKDLCVHYSRRQGEHPGILDRVSLDVRRGEIFGLAGESGSGKSTLAESILRLLEPPRYVRSGSVLFHPRSGGEVLDLMTLPEHRLQAVRWRNISYIPQGSMNSLNPVLRVQQQIADAMLDHGMTKHDAEARVPEVLELVGLEAPVARLFPHQLSGGMKQRAVIAAAIAMNPDLVIADEITTALDVNMQRVILETLVQIRDRLGVAVIFVSHDMAVHAELDDRLAVMYAGQVVEVTDVRSVFKDALHPYVQGLIGSIPSLHGERTRLAGIGGRAPSPANWPPGCRFHPRCPHCVPGGASYPPCQSVVPVLAEVHAGHAVKCHLYPQSRREAGDGA